MLRLHSLQRLINMETNCCVKKDDAQTSKQLHLKHKRHDAEQRAYLLQL